MIPAKPAGVDNGCDDGKIRGMKATIDKAGRVVIPRALREQAHLSPGTVLEIRYRAGILEIEPAPLDVRLERQGHLLIAVPRVATEELTQAMVDRSLHAIREGRGDVEA